MDNQFLRQGALAGQGLDGRRAEARGDAGIAMDEAPFPAIVNLRGKAKDKTFMAAAEKALGASLPTKPNTVAEGEGVSVLWMSPEEWWVIVRKDDAIDAETKLADKLRAALGDCHCAVTEVGESRTSILVSGPCARDLLNKGCPLDLHRDIFGGPGNCAQTMLAKSLVVLNLVGDDESEGPTFEVYVLRSFADYLWSWLEDAAGEYGMVVFGS